MGSRANVARSYCVALVLESIHHQYVNMLLTNRKKQNGFYTINAPAADKHRRHPGSNSSKLFMKRQNLLYFLSITNSQAIEECPKGKSF